MSNSDSEDAPIREAGYRNPPVEHRFKKGISGNPNGRPKKKKGFNRNQIDALSELFLEEAERKVVLNEGGKATEMAAIRALVRSGFVNGIKGDRHTREGMLRKIASLVEDRDNRLSRDLDIAVRYRATWLPVFEECERINREPPPILPHPRDIIIELPSQTIKIVGPCSSTEHAKYDRARETRDQLGYEVQKMDRAIADGVDIPSFKEWREYCADMFHKFEEIMPPSLRWRGGRL